MSPRVGTTPKIVVSGPERKGEGRERGVKRREREKGTRERGREGRRDRVKHPRRVPVRDTECYPGTLFIRVQSRPLSVPGMVTVTPDGPRPRRKWSRRSCSTRFLLFCPGFSPPYRSGVVRKTGVATHDPPRPRPDIRTPDQRSCRKSSERKIELMELSSKLIVCH